MTRSERSAAQGCVFCAIAARQAEASVAYEDETVVAFMDLHPVTPGHLLVVPRGHAVGLEDLDAATGAHVWSVGHAMARALRRSTLRCEGINVLVCDGEVAFHRPQRGGRLAGLERFHGQSVELEPELFHPRLRV